MKTCCSHADERWWGDGTMQKKKKWLFRCGAWFEAALLNLSVFPAEGDTRLCLPSRIASSKQLSSSRQTAVNCQWCLSYSKKKEGTDIINMKTFWKSSERQQQFKSAFYSLVVFEFRVVEMDGITPLRSASCSDHCRLKNTTHEFINSKEWREFNTVKILNLVTAYTIPEKSSTVRC